MDISSPLFLIDYIAYEHYGSWNGGIMSIWSSDQLQHYQSHSNKKKRYRITANFSTQKVSEKLDDGNSEGRTTNSGKNSRNINRTTYDGNVQGAKGWYLLVIFATTKKDPLQRTIEQERSNSTLKQTTKRFLEKKQ